MRLRSNNCLSRSSHSLDASKRGSVNGKHDLNKWNSISRSRFASGVRHSFHGSPWAFNAVLEHSPTIQMEKSEVRSSLAKISPSWRMQDPRELPSQKGTAVINCMKSPILTSKEKYNLSNHQDSNDASAIASEINFVRVNASSED